MTELSGDRPASCPFCGSPAATTLATDGHATGEQVASTACGARGRVGSNYTD